MRLVRVSAKGADDALRPTDVDAAAETIRGDLEDLYVTPSRRGEGHGKALLATLARRCVERGYGRLEWSVLDWNTPAIDFYVRLGAARMEEWTVHRMTGTALASLAAEASAPTKPLASP